MPRGTDEERKGEDERNDTVVNFSQTISLNRYFPVKFNFSIHRKWKFVRSGVDFKKKEEGRGSLTIAKDVLRGIEERGGGNEGNGTVINICCFFFISSWKNTRPL